MRKDSLIMVMLVLMTMMGLTGCSDDDEGISRRLAWSIVKKNVLNNDLEHVEVWVSKEPIQPHTIIDTYSTPVTSPDKESWFFFINDVPYGNWSHSCRYVFVDIASGNFDIIQHGMPPFNLSEPDYILLVTPPIIDNR